MRRWFCAERSVPFQTTNHRRKQTQNDQAKLKCVKDYFDLRAKGELPTVPIALAALKSCTNARDLETGTEIHQDVLFNGLFRNICVANSLVDMYGKCGKTAEAHRTFDHIQNRTVVSWNSLIMGYAQNGQPDLALDLFSTMQDQGFVPAARTYVAAVKACTALASEEEGKRPIDGARRLKRSLEKGLAIHSQLAKAGHESYVFLANALIDMYGKCGSLEHGREVFRRMKYRDEVTWNSMILGCALNGEGEEALELFSRMDKAASPPPNSLTFVAVLKACGNLVALETGRNVHRKTLNEGLHRDELVVTSLIDFYGKCGSMAEAKSVFDTTETAKDLVTWTALLAGYSHQGDTAAVFRLFTDMQTLANLNPNGITFLFVLASCSHAGLVDKGKFFFQEMTLRYSITPTIDHYTCLVDLLGRANRLDEAFEVVKSMPVEADFGIWISLLGACRKWKNLELGRAVFESMRRMESDDRDSAAYVLMGSIYGSAGMWEENRRVQEMRVAAHAWKRKPGQSWWVESSGKVHRFMVGDSSHPQREAIVARMGGIMLKMKKEKGYVEPELASVPGEENGSGVCEHSERLAIGCALLNTAPGTVIRIAKNLRVCDECHKFTAIVSSIEKRVLVCRDSSRFHVFQDGKCSCADFW